jgi:hypothetical protein
MFRLFKSLAGPRFPQTISQSKIHELVTRPAVNCSSMTQEDIDVLLRHVDCRNYEGLTFSEFSKALMALHLIKKFETADEADIADRFGADALQSEYEHFPEFIRQLA